jgi:hypothetical protein
MIPAFERVKRDHALDLAATAIGGYPIYAYKNSAQRHFLYFLCTRWTLDYITSDTESIAAR